MNIIEEIKQEVRLASVEPSRRDLNILALLFFAIPSAIGAWQLWKGNSGGWIWIAVGAVLVISRLFPPLFRRIYRLWIGFSVVLGFFVSRILLTIIFFVVITPTGIIMKLMGKDPMDRKFDPKVTSYWKRKEQTEESSVQRYEKQF